MENLRTKAHQEKRMQCYISQDLVFKILEWVLFIGLSVASGWFASGVLEQFFSQKTSFAQYEEKFNEYPVISFILSQRKASEVNLNQVLIKYKSNGIEDTQLQIGENHWHHKWYNKTQKVILERMETAREGIAFRLIHATPILVKRLARVSITLYTNLQKERNSTIADMIYILVTSRENSPGFFYWKWKDGQPMEIIMKQNTFAKYNIQPQITKYLEETGKCQQESYFECIASQLDTTEFNECTNKCIPNLFSNLEKNYNIPFCQNDTDNENCALNVIDKILKQEIGYKCKKSCLNVAYVGELSTTRAKNNNYTKNWNVYEFRYVLRNEDFASKVYEEYFIYDAVGMIGSVGGTLGFLNNSRKI